jgi:hypothetical protein
MPRQKPMKYFIASIDILSNSSNYTLHGTNEKILTME